jgi:hypothetical protein
MKNKTLFEIKQNLDILGFFCDGGRNWSAFSVHPSADMTAKNRLFILPFFRSLGAYTISHYLLSNHIWSLFL